MRKAVMIKCVYSHEVNTTEDTGNVCDPLMRSIIDACHIDPCKVACIAGEESHLQERGSSHHPAPPLPCRRPYLIPSPNIPR